MNQRDTALASLRDRTHRAAVTRDPNLLLDEIALSDARRLVAVVDPETDIPAAHALGWFCWLRYLVLSGENAEEELQAALALFKPVFDRNPYAVPTALQRWYLQAEANIYAYRYGSAPGGPPRLPVFHAAVRSTVESAPKTQPDRSKFLLDAALMLRGIAGRGVDEAVLVEAAELTLAAVGTGPATLPPQRDARRSLTAEAFLEPAKRQPVSAAFAAPWRSMMALLPPAHRVTTEHLPTAWWPETDSVRHRPSHRRERRMEGGPGPPFDGYIGSRRRGELPVGTLAPPRGERVPRDRRPELASPAGFTLATAAQSTPPPNLPEPRRHLWAQLPDRVGVGHRVPLLVWISTTGKAGTSAPLKPFPVPPEGRRIVVAVSAPGFELISDADQELLVPPSGDSDPIRFALRAVKRGLHRVRIDAFASARSWDE